MKITINRKDEILLEGLKVGRVVKQSCGIGRDQVYVAKRQDGTEICRNMRLRHARRSNLVSELAARAASGTL